MLLVQARPADYLPALLGGGVSAGNHKIGQAAGSNRLVYRLVPQATKTLWDVWIETRARSGPNCSPQLADADSGESSSYSGGNPNNWLWEVRFHPVGADGRFDPATNLVTALQFNPYTQRRNTSFQIVGSYTYSALKIPVGSAGLAVTAGTPIAMTIAPVNGAPATDFCSANHLYLSDSSEGAQARNEIVATARDTLYGLDPRMTLGGASADGTSQWYPGNNFNGAPFSKHLPTFVLVYSDGTTQAQPYFSAAFGSDPTVAGVTYTTTFKPPSSGVFTRLRAFFNAADSFPATLAKNGSDVATVTVKGDPTAGVHVVDVALPSPVTYAAGDSFTVRFATSVDNAIVRIYANGVFESILGLGASDLVSLTGDVKRAMPIMPVPWPWPVLRANTAPTGAPSTPGGYTATGSAGAVTLAWTATEAWTDHYDIQRDGVTLGTATGASYVDTTGVVGTSYAYKVRAVAYDGRASAYTATQSAASSAVATYRTTVLADSPVSYWRLGESSGTAAADEQAVNAGTYSGVTLGTTSLLNGDANTAATFDGSASYMKAADSASLRINGPISLEAWIKPAQLKVAIIQTKAGVGSWAYGLELQANGTIKFFINNGTTTSFVASAAVSTGTKYHVVGTWDGTTTANKLIIYVNGSATAATSAISTLKTSAAQYFVGAAATADTGAATTERFNGVIDEPAIYNTALSAARVSAHYAAGA